MNKIEFKLFITFFFFYSIFIYWTSWNEETNFVLTRAIVEERSFYLDSYRNKTGDILYLNGHYIASFSRWEFSILNAFPYFFLQFLIKDANLLKFLLSISTSTLFSSLSIIFLYRFLQKFLKKEKCRIFTLLSYGFSTLMFQQSRFFTTHTPEAFFTLLSFYLFLLYYKKDRNRKLIILLGILIGVGILLTSLFEVFSLFSLLLLLKEKKIKECIIISCLVILIHTPLLIVYFQVSKLYSTFFSLFASFYLPTHSYLKELSFLPKGFKYVSFPIPVFLQLMIFPSKGLLFFYPILVFSFFGFLFSKDYKLENLFSLFFIIFVLLIISLFLPLWWLGWVSYGPSRVLTILMPFFAIGLSSFIRKFGFKVLIPFFLISALNNFLLLQYGEDKISTLSWEEYKYKMEHFQVLSNPLFDHYLPLTLINGPRSVLLENLIINKKISIDFKHPYNPKTPEFVPPGSPIMKKFEVYLFSIPKIGIMVLRLPWLSMFVIGVLLILIWKDEIFRKIRISNWILVLILSLIFFASFIRVRNIAYGDNWCASQWDENNKRLEESRWIGQNATLYLFSKENTEKILRLSVESFKGNQTLEIYLNGKFIGNYTIQKRREISQPIKLKEGINELMLRTKGDFIHPWLTGVNCDIDLVSFKILKLNIY